MAKTSIILDVMLDDNPPEVNVINGIMKDYNLTFKRGSNIEGVLSYEALTSEKDEKKLLKIWEALKGIKGFYHVGITIGNKILTNKGYWRDMNTHTSMASTKALEVAAKSKPKVKTNEVWILITPNATTPSITAINAVGKKYGFTFSAAPNLDDGDTTPQPTSFQAVAPLPKGTATKELLALQRDLKRVAGVSSVDIMWKNQWLTPRGWERAEELDGLGDLSALQKLMHKPEVEEAEYLPVAASAVLLASTVEKVRQGNALTTYELAPMINRLAYANLSADEIADRFTKAFADVLLPQE